MLERGTNIETPMSSGFIVRLPTKYSSVLFCLLPVVPAQSDHAEGVEGDDDPVDPVKTAALDSNLPLY